MNYLYALMGITMISGIMSMLEISTSVSKQSLYSTPPVDPYFATDSTASAADRAFLKILTTQADSSWGTGQEFCNQLKIETTKISILASNYTVQGSSQSSHSKLFNSCTLTSPNHRVIISYRNPTVNTYGLFSCMNSSSLYCDIEN